MQTVLGQCTGVGDREVIDRAAREPVVGADAAQRRQVRREAEGQIRRRQRAVEQAAGRERHSADVWTRRISHSALHDIRHILSGNNMATTRTVNSTVRLKVIVMPFAAVVARSGVM